MSANPAVSIRHCFAQVPDFRRAHNRKHNLWDRLLLMDTRGNHVRAVLADNNVFFLEPDWTASGSA